MYEIPKSQTVLSNDYV